jgi:hypothetical protein
VAEMNLEKTTWSRTLQDMVHMNLQSTLHTSIVKHDVVRLPLLSDPQRLAGVAGGG